MSELGNYLNTTQELKDSIDQSAPTFTQITDDKKNFEQQFLIGASLMAKGKATEQLVGLLKKSKRIAALRGKGEDAIRKLAKSGQDRVEGLAKDLTSKIKGVTQPTEPPVVNPSANPTDLKSLEDARDVAFKQRDATKSALENANNDMIDTRQAVKDANDIRDAQEAIVNSNTERAVAQAGGRISAQQQINDANARSQLNEARSGVDAAEKGAQDAEDARNALADQLVQHENAATNAAKDLANASQPSEEAASAAASSAAEAETAATTGKEAARLARLVKAEKVAKDTEEAAAASEEIDPLGAVAAIGAALATQIIGRKIKAHEELQTGGLSAGIVPKLNYSSTLGA